MSHRPLEFWFDFGSPYSYLAAARITPLAAAAGLEVVWRPFLLGPLFKAMGYQDSPFNADIPRRNHMWIDMARQAEKFGLPFNQPTVFPRRALLATRVAIATAEASWLPEYCRRMFRTNFVDDQELDTPAAIAAATDGLVADLPALLAAASSDETKEATRRRGEYAQARGVFGAPNFFVGEALFWGNDRLEDALHWAVTKAPADTGA